MKLKLCTNPTCARPYQVNQFTPRMSHSYELGKVTCPHCGTQVKGDGNSVFLTHALSAKEEADFHAEYGGNKREAKKWEARQTDCDNMPKHDLHALASSKTVANNGKSIHHPSACARDGEHSSHAERAAPVKNSHSQ